MPKKTHDALPLFPGLHAEPTAAALRAAFDRIDTRMTYDEFMADPIRALCLKNIAREIDRKRHRRP